MQVAKVVREQAIFGAGWTLGLVIGSDRVRLDSVDPDRLLLWLRQVNRIESHPVRAKAEPKGPS